MNCTTVGPESTEEGIFSSAELICVLSLLDGPAICIYVSCDTCNGAPQQKTSTHDRPWRQSLLPSFWRCCSLFEIDVGRFTYCSFQTHRTYSLTGIQVLLLQALEKSKPSCLHGMRYRMRLTHLRPPNGPHRARWLIMQQESRQETGTLFS